MRLIDAEALKKAIHSYENRKLPLDTVIENAPTIVTTNDEILIKEYLSKCNCCDECFAEIYCITHDLRDSRYPNDYCVSNIKDYLKEAENERKQ